MENFSEVFVRRFAPPSPLPHPFRAGAVTYLPHGTGKQDVEKFLRRVQLKAFFHDKEDDSNTSYKDIFKTLQTRKSKWTPPEGQFASLDFLSKNAVMTSITLISIVTPNFPTFLRKRERRSKILVSAKT